MIARTLPTNSLIFYNQTALGQGNFLLRKNEQMEIKGKVHCFFEQSGTFKNEFIKLGIPAEDYDIQDNFGETDHVVDIFENIQNAYEGGGKHI